MQKLITEKDEAVADIIERILEAEGEEVLLVVPKRSRLVESPNNFRLLAREGNVLSKTIMIESVDEKVLELAKANGLASTHPLFDDTGRAGAVSDILPRAADERPRKKGGAVSLTVQHDDRDAEEDEEEEEGEDADAENVSEEPADDELEEEPSRATVEERYDTLGRPRRMRRFARLALFLIVLFGIAWGATAAFGKATVRIAFKKEPWTHSQAVLGATAATRVDAERNAFPAQLFEEQKTLTQSFPASGRANVSEKAKGTITIVNAYSSESQQLVATTRFETPDGKVYRIDNEVLIPGAKIENGRVIPASIKAPVTADGAGPSYNVGRVEKLTIPGFKGTPKFDGFYGVLEEGASGGFSGEKAVATDDDAAKAEAKVREIIQAAFETTFIGGIPADIKVLDGSRAMEVTKVTVNRSTDASGNFSVAATATFRAFGVREKDIATLLEAKAKAMNADIALRDVTLKYSNVVPDFGAKELRFTINAEGNIVPAFDPAAFEESILGRKEGEVAAMVVALPEIAEAAVTLKPSWMRRVPDDPDRVNVVVE